jgi:hypothetical protein
MPRSRRQQQQQQPPVARAASSASVSGSRDESLKLQSAALLRTLGYFTQLEVPFDVALYAEGFRRGQATDLDVLAVRFDGDFQETRIISECKSGEQHAMEELLKLSAVVQFFHASRGWLVKTRIADNARQVAKRLSVRPLDHDELAILLRGWELDPAEVLARERAFYGAELSLQRALHAEDASRTLLRYCDSDVWLREFWESIHNLIYLLSKRNESGLNTDQSEHRYLAFRVATLMSICVLRLCGEIAQWKLSNPDRGVELFVFGGAAGRRERERMFDQLRQTVPAEVFRDRSLDPPFLDALKDVVAAMLRNSRSARRVPRCLQHAIQAYFSDDPNLPELPKPADVWDEVTLKLAKDVVEFTLAASGVDARIAAAFLAA